jgi:hypothetical protein
MEQNNTKDLSLRFEDMETNSCDPNSGNYNIVIWLNENGSGCTDDQVLVVNVDIENDLDYDSWQIHWVSINSIEVYDEDDVEIDLDVDKGRIEKFIENSKKVYEHIDDQLQGMAEDSKLEAGLANLESKEFESQRWALGE